MTTKPEIPTPVVAAIQHVLEYIWQDEERDYEAEPGEGHLFLTLRQLAEWTGWEP